MRQAQRRPYRTAALLRAAYIPMPVKNYGLALLGVPLTPYVVTLIPIELLDTYLPIAVGSSARDLAALLRGELEGEAAERTWLSLGLVALALLSTVGLLTAIAMVTKRVIDGRRAEESGELTGEERRQGANNKSALLV